MDFEVERKTKRYLGDSVYADWDGYHVVLTTENGYGPSNRICLEPEVIAAINDYYRYCSEKRIEISEGV